MTAEERLHVRVAGRVQGVGFRWFIREEARRLGLAGWVRNLPSGDVELMAEGERDALDSLARAVAKGPPGARVEVVHKLPGLTSADALPSPFTIER
ncbi:MAG TPA: acylphosphatase [Gemmatimonadaceae bacterium]|nr:acylphosphatase [Gemmatimonadaceae bacterium]